MSSAGVRDENNDSKRTIKSLITNEAQFIQSLRVIANTSTLQGIGATGGGINNSPQNASGNYLLKSGDVMIGQLGDEFGIANINSGILDISKTSGVTNPLIILNPEDGLPDELDTIIQGSDVFSFQRLRIRTANENITFTENGNIITPQIGGIVIPPDNIVELVYDIILQIWRILSITDRINGESATLPDPTTQYQHLQSNEENQWIAKQELEFGALSADAGQIRIPNDSIGIAWRNNTDDGNIELKVNPSGFLDITNSANDTVVISLRAQNDTFEDIQSSWEQLPNVGNLGGTTTFRYPTELAIVHGAGLRALFTSDDKFKIYNSNDIATAVFNEPVDSFDALSLEGNILVNLVSVLFNPFNTGSDNGAIITKNTGGIVNRIEDNTLKYIFGFGNGGTIPLTDVLEISTGEINVKTLNITNIDKAIFVQDSGAVAITNQSLILLNSSNQFQFNTDENNDFIFSLSNNSAFAIDQNGDDRNFALLSDSTNINSTPLLLITKAFLSPMDFQPIGVISFRAGNSSGSTLSEYARITSRIEDNTLGTIDGSLGLEVTINNSLTSLVRLNENSSGKIGFFADLIMNSKDIIMGTGEIIAGGFGKEIRNIGELVFVNNTLSPAGSGIIYFDGTDLKAKTGVGTVNFSDIGKGTFLDSIFRIQGSGDQTKQLAFEVDSFTTSTTRTFTWPDANGEVLVNPSRVDWDLNTFDIFNIDSITFTEIAGSLSSVNIGFSALGGGGIRANVLNNGDFEITEENILHFSFDGGLNSINVIDSLFSVLETFGSTAYQILKFNGETILNEPTKIQQQIAGSDIFDIQSGGISMADNKFISNVDQIGFRILGNFIEDNASGMRYISVPGDQHLFGDGTNIFATLNVDGLFLNQLFIQFTSIPSPGITGSSNVGELFMDSGNSNHLSIIRNSSVIDLEGGGFSGKLSDLIIDGNKDWASSNFVSVASVGSSAGNVPTVGFLRMSSGDEIRMTNPTNTTDLIFTSGLDIFSNPSFIFKVENLDQLVISEFDIDVKQNHIVSTGNITPFTNTSTIGVGTGGGYDFVMRNSISWEEDPNIKLVFDSDGILLETDGSTNNIKIKTLGNNSVIDIQAAGFIEFSIGSATPNIELGDIFTSFRHTNIFLSDGAEYISFFDAVNGVTVDTPLISTNIILFNDLTTGELSVKKFGGTVVSLESGGGESNTASNLGATTFGLFAQKSGIDLEFKSLIAGTNITLSQTATEITINSTGSGTSFINFTADADLIMGDKDIKNLDDLTFTGISSLINLNGGDITNFDTIQGLSGGGSNIEMLGGYINMDDGEIRDADDITMHGNSRIMAVGITEFGLQVDNASANVGLAGMLAIPVSDITTVLTVALLDSTFGTHKGAMGIDHNNLTNSRLCIKDSDTSWLIFDYTSRLT